MFTRRFFILFLSCIAVALAGVLWAPVLTLAKALLLILAIVTIVDALIVWVTSRFLRAKRDLKEHLSLNQPNQVDIQIGMRLPAAFTKLLNVTSYDTVPATFKSKGNEEMHGLGSFTYYVMPTSRGRYEMDVIRCFVTTRVLGLCQAVRFLSRLQIVKVYPSFHHLDKLEVMATEQNTKHGSKRLRRAGNSTDFDQIRAYVPGDDVRTVNWKATARSASLMVNTYTDERSQPIISVLCGGPSMLIATDGISLLDRATSAAIALAQSSVKHYDEAGLITVSHRGVDLYMPPERSSNTVAKMLDHTYSFSLPPTDSERIHVMDPDVLPEGISESNLADLRKRLDTCEADADLDALATYALTRLKRKSMLVLFANFENIEVARQAIPALKRISRRHTLLVILFENEGVTRVAKAPFKKGAKVSEKLSEKRFRALCADYLEQQQLLASYLKHNNINVLTTTPDALTVSVLQKYLEMKNRAIV